MLGIIEQKDVVTGCHAGNTDKYLLLILVKLGLDTAVLSLSCRKLHTSFLSMCSLSIILADLVVVFCLARMWFIGPETYVSLCFLLANASTTYGALPLPMTCLGLLDYCFEGTYPGNQSAFCKYLRNAVLTLLVWILAVMYSLVSTDYDLMILDFGTRIKALVCVVGESTLVTYFTLGLFIALICAMLPYWSMIPQWVKEAEKLTEEREKRENLKSDLLFTSTYGTETKSGEEKYVEETVPLCPPLWLSLTLGFALFWMPYLAVSVACLIFGFDVPAYITVNVLWLECTNSLLMGVVFWVNSNAQGPYSNLPENLCVWQVYWHMSKGTQQKQLPVAVINPSKEKANTLLYV